MTQKQADYKQRPAGKQNPAGRFSLSVGRNVVKQKTGKSATAVWP